MIPSVNSGNDFDGLLVYLQKRGHSLIEPRDTSVEEIVEQMKMVADLSTRCTKPVKHLTFSAAKEDGRLADETWLELVDAAEQELGMEGHLRVIVRHTDKTYDHVHSFWCTVNVNTGQTPAKRWFRVRNTEHMEEVGPRALTAEQAELVPKNARQLRSYDAHALTRMQHLCRAFERRNSLRQLATPSEAKRARENGAEQSRDRKQQHRGKRTGDSLTDQAIEIRKALDAPTYSDRATHLHGLGLAMRAATQRLKTGQERTRGVLIYDILNPANAVPASRFDLPIKKFGLGALDSRTTPGAPRFIQWIKTYIAPEPKAPQITSSHMRDRYEAKRADHRNTEAKKSHNRRMAKARHANERRELRAKLMLDRKELARVVPPADRRAIYAAFDEDVRAPTLKALAKQHRTEAEKFTRARFPTFELWKGRLLVAAHKLVFPTSQIPTPWASPLNRIRLLKTIPSLSSSQPKLIDRATPGIRLLEQAAAQSNELVRNPHMIAKGGPSLPSESQRPATRNGITAQFELTSYARDEGGRASTAIEGFHSSVRGADVAYCIPGMPIAFIDRGAVIDVLTGDDLVLRAATTLALSRGAATVLLHADQSVVDRVRRLTADHNLVARDDLALSAERDVDEQIVKTQTDRISIADLLRRSASALQVNADANSPPPPPGIRSTAKGSISTDISGSGGTSPGGRGG